MTFKTWVYTKHVQTIAIVDKALFMVNENYFKDTVNEFYTKYPLLGILNCRNVCFDKEGR